MLSLLPANVPANYRPGRRELLRMASASAMAAAFPRELLATAGAGDNQPQAATAKRCIYIFLCGGPSQLEMWDPKPEAPDQIRGPFDTIATAAPGIRIGSLLPQTARVADRFSIIRSMTVPTTSHDIGIMRTLLASKVGAVDNKAYPAEPADHPAIGAILHRLLGRTGLMPPWAVIPRHFTTGDRFYKGQAAGLLGHAYAPFALDSEKSGSLQRTEFELKNLDLRASGMTAGRLAERRQLLNLVEQTGDVGARGAAARQMQAQYRTAFRMLTSTELKQAFDVTRESPALRERYGMNEYGQSFLLARRLVERDVRMVNVFWTFYGEDGCQFNLWDNHGVDGKVCGGPNRGVDMLTHDYCCPSFDRAFSTLIEDLDERGLLEETLVTVVGEFGRTPRINKMAGRDHWGSCYSAVLAGGGVQGGRIHGASDGNAAYVKDLPVTTFDLQATVLHAFGFSPEAAVPDAAGRPIRISDGHPVTSLF